MRWRLRQQAVPAITFGGTGLLTAVRQLQSNLRSASPAQLHFGLHGAYIAAVSAISATSPLFIPWP
ncbi:hypothetical protein GKZ68_11725 [Hymenobacter sp. BRD128]|uniref:hypothetical protein n=1 Tax=Hymenobacter sp. BRD128 TaxID=2675878 RepID=UPI0015661C1A|nr:hypothetical protein [Hymenobacter sp. BRD128]QKG57227.1 hypothetical protein GKZ68_11725 [Hymenobacter sp. BRD128]